MTTRGVTLAFLIAFRDSLRDRQYLTPTTSTADVCRNHLRDPKGASVIDALVAAGAGGVVGEAGWYIIHDHDCSFDDLVDAVDDHLRASAGDGARGVVVWMDVMSIPQRKEELIRTPVFVNEVLPRTIRRIGRSLIVVDDALKPRAMSNV
ncbi:hypothetical protein HK101_005973, partial [Irineochytrium annulatum]